MLITLSYAAVIVFELNIWFYQVFNLLRLMDSSRGPKRGWWLPFTYADEGDRCATPNATNATVYA